MIMKAGSGMTSGRKKDEKMRRKAFGKIMVPVLALFLLSLLIFRERAGIDYDHTGDGNNGWNTASYTDAVSQTPSCLILSSSEAVSTQYTDMMQKVLSGMKIAYDICDVEQGFDADILDRYDTVVVTFQEWSVLGDEIFPVFSWVESGGCLLDALTPSVDGYFQAVSMKFGIEMIGSSYPAVYGIRFFNDCMLGASQDDVFWYDRTKEEGIVSSIQTNLKSDCSIYAESEDGKTSLVWTRDYGSGRLAMVNEVITEKYQRGVLCLAYSLLEDVMVYPVINASAFYLDDFPSPVPEGNAEYIKRDYGMDVASFYANIWWPQMMEWEKKYGIRHTGMIIEDYSDEVQAPFEQNIDVSRFLTYGNMLLNNGGELGFHGYNHMPLCLDGVDENKQYGAYRLWTSEADMEASVRELERFSKKLFPENKFQVYVPPSNILSESGRKALLHADPDIKVIASTYLRDADGIAYEQEFQVEDDGIISTPRITSGCILDDYQMMTALSELNFQFVQSHFTHPDDTMDADRGADKGWKYMSSRLEEYLDWIYTSAPDIRNVTGSGMGEAVEQYDRLTMQRETTDEGIKLHLGSFSGEASFLVRVNNGNVTKVDGGTLELVSRNIYLLTADDADVMIYLGETT